MRESQPPIACAWHEPKNTIVNRKTGQPLNEDIIRTLDQNTKESSGICNVCLETHFPEQAKKLKVN